MRPILPSPLLVTALTLTAALACMPCAAEVVKYKDKNGVVHYSDNVNDRDGSAKALPISPPPERGPEGPYARENWQHLEAAANNRLKREEFERQQRRAAEERKRMRCDAAKERYQSAINSRAYRTVDPLSGNSINNFSERNARINAAEEVMRNECEG